MSIYEDIVELYKGENYSIKTSGWGPYHIIDGLSTGGGVTQLEVDYFNQYADEFPNPKIFIVGNAFGFSTFMFSKIFKNASIDVIDAEIEGSENKLGSEITRNIASKNNLDINLTIGFSPDDTPRARRYERYDIVFIDGLHSNEQLIKDFDGIKNHLNQEKFICFMHDIRLFSMQRAFDHIIDSNKGMYDDYIVSLPDIISQSGIGIVSKNVKLIK